MPPISRPLRSSSERGYNISFAGNSKRTSKLIHFFMPFTTTPNKILPNLCKGVARSKVFFNPARLRSRDSWDYCRGFEIHSIFRSLVCKIKRTFKFTHLWSVFWIVIFVALLSSCSQKEAPTLYGVSSEGTPFDLMGQLVYDAYKDCMPVDGVVCGWKEIKG